MNPATTPLIIVACWFTALLKAVNRQASFPVKLLYAYDRLSFFTIVADDSNLSIGYDFHLSTGAYASR